MSHKIRESLIESRGGSWEQEYGIDGTIDGDPVEVRGARKDYRFRLGKDVHRELVSDRGSYLFHDDQEGTREVPATEVSDILGKGKWFKDREYPHRFVEVDEIF